MRLIGALACALVFLAGSSTALARGNNVPGKCPKSLGHIVAANSQAVIYEALEPNVTTGRLVNACTSSSMRFVRLGVTPVCGAPVCLGVRHELLAGSIAAYESFFTSEGVGRWYVVVRDLRSGKILRHLPTGTLLKPTPGNAGVGPVTALVVKPNGSVAWIAEDFERSAPSTSTSEAAPYFDVYASDKSGTRLLASGLDVRSSSLALAGSTLYWTQGGKPASAVLN